MNFKQLFLGSAVALMALTACNKNTEDIPVPTPKVGETTGLIRIQISSAGLRADGPNDSGTGEAGTTAEQGVTNVSTYVFAPDGSFVDSKDYTKKTGALSTADGISEADAEGKFLVENSATLVLPFKTFAKPGVDNVLFVVINKPSFFPSTFTNKDDFTDAVADASALMIQDNSKYVDGFKKLITDDQFMMVGECPKFNLTKDLTYDQVKGDFSATDKSKNQFALKVDRVVSKLVVDYNKEDLLNSTFGTGDAKAKLLGYSFDGGVDTSGKLYYTVANSNKHMYIFNNPNINEDGDLAGVANADYKTPYMDQVSTETDLTAAYNFYKDFFYRISEDATDNKIGASGVFVPIEVKKQEKDISYDPGKYFMEADNNEGKWLWANTPVAKIYACVLPSKVYYLSATDKLEAKTITSLEDLKGITEVTNAAVKTITGDGSFLRAANGRYYASQAAANFDGGKAFDTAAGSGVKTDRYDKGRCLYRFPVNADSYNYREFNNAYNKRNHIYLLTITDILAIGDNFDPTDPTDPNVPQPENPDQPDVDPNQPINQTTVYAAVKATMKNWTVVKNNVVLGKK